MEKLARRTPTKLLEFMDQANNFINVKDTSSLDQTQDDKIGTGRHEGQDIKQGYSPLEDNKGVRRQ